MKIHVVVIVVVKIILTLLFLGCLFNWNYEYYQAVRFIGMLGFVILAYYEIRKDEFWLIVWIGSAVLINPFFKFTMNKEMWNVIDVVWAAILIGTIVFKQEFRNMLLVYSRKSVDVVDRDEVFVDSDVLNIYSNIYENRKGIGKNLVIDRKILLTNGHDNIEIDVCLQTDLTYRLGGTFNSVKQVESLIEVLSDYYGGGEITYRNWFNKKDPFAISRIVINIVPKQISKPTLVKKRPE